MFENNNYVMGVAPWAAERIDSGRTRASLIHYNGGETMDNIINKE